MKVILERFSYHPSGTQGRLILPNGEVLFTVEREWQGNKPFKSCIPEGVYRCKPFSGRKYKGVYEICNVPGRTAILFHAANYPAQLEGCIAPGLTLIPKDVGVQNSRAAMAQLKALLGEQEFDLHITHFVAEYP